ncbi:Actin family like protein [Aduncisulcus paluster]|uniref:Actin family like protein n=1 Tax=Aduncisulcus paluster TaxID=2918883 RepID=A0ABQ5K221_9EUKA|nr:Actin family like protein [Aduncisulcus paluster]
MSYILPIILNPGCYSFKCGFAGSTTPKLIIKTLLGKQASKAGQGSSTLKRSVFFGEEAEKSSSAYGLTISRPYSSSGINWEDISSFYEHIISKLEVTPEHPFAISVPFLHADEFMKRSAEILFEKLRVPNVLFQPESVMSLASIGATTGLVVIMGYRSTSICPVFESYEMSHASRNISIGGHNVSNSLRSLMKEEDPTFSPSSVELELIKTMLGVCASSRATPHEAKPPSIEYELPDGKVIRLNDSRWKCVESFFPEYDVPPSSVRNSRLFIGRKEYKTIPECILGSILSLDIPYQKELTSCICLCGGSSMFPGLDDRIHGDLSLISDHLPTRPKVIAKPERDIASYMGISIYASVTHCFSKMAVSRKEYEERGSL